MKTKNVYCVYCHTNLINNKKYIGITSQLPNHRWGKDGNGYKGQLKFYRAIQKYGWDNFSHEILFENLTLEDANEKEKELIKTYDTVKKGYNVTLGGSDGSHFYRKVKQFTFDGELVAEYDSILDAKQAINLKSCSGIIGCCLGYNLSCYDYIWRYAEDDFDKYDTDIHSADRHQNFKKPVSQYTIDGKYIKDFKSATEAVNETNISSIYQNCLGVLQSAGGYIWRYSNGSKEDICVDFEKIKQKSIIQYSLDGELLCEYHDATEAYKITGITQGEIIGGCKGRYKQNHGYIFRYKHEPLTKEDIIKANSGFSHQKQVNQYTLDGIFLATFNTITDANLNLGKPKKDSNISQCCKGNRKTAFKYKWFYADDPKQPDKTKIHCIDLAS